MTRAMALRLIEMVLREKDGGEVRELLKEHKVLEHRQVRLPDGEVLVRILLDAEQSEAVLDLLEKQYAGGEGNRVVILPVEATLPRAEPEPAATPGQPPSGGKIAGADRPRGVVRGHQRCRAVFAGLSGDGGVVHHRGGHRSAPKQRGHHHRGDGDCAVARAEHGVVARHDVG